MLVELKIQEVSQSLRQAPELTDSIEDSPFSIKSFNVLTDKMARGVCKKIFLLGSKEEKAIPLIAKEISKELKEKDLMSDEVKTVIREMVMSKKAPSKKEEGGLFDIKELNAIEDKMVRGLAKKIYIMGKKENKNSNDVILNIVKELKDNNKMDESLESMLKGLVK